MNESKHIEIGYFRNLNRKVLTDFALSNKKAKVSEFKENKREVIK